MYATTESCPVRQAFRRLSLLAALAAGPALAEPISADVAELLKSMQARLDRLEARNAELERRLAQQATPLPAQPAAPQADAALAARVADMEKEVATLRDKPDPLGGIHVGASLILAAQRVDGGGADESQLNTRADIEVELPAGAIGDAEGRVFAHFRAGDGDGVGNGSFATPNATVLGNVNAPVLMQAWYQLDIPLGGDSGNLGQLEVTLGKIDPFGFFDGNAIADDESEQFMNLAFIHNPLLDAGGDIGVGAHGASPGVRLAWVSDINGGNHWTASLGLFGAGNGADFNTSVGNPLTLAQLEYAGKLWKGLEGAYRLYGWSNAQAWDTVNDLDANGEFDDTQEKHTGFGLSLDQQISANTTLFARYGHSRKGTLPFDKAYTLGAQFGGAAWGRDNDRIGLAFGSLATSDAYRAAGSGSGSERILELFYALQLNDTVQITPGIQRIDNPAGARTGDQTVWTLRAKAAF